MPNRRGDALRWSEVAKEKTAEELLKLKIEKHARQAALVARMRRDARYSGYDNMARAISDAISTSSRAGAGRAMSAEAQINGLGNEYMGAMLAGMERAGALPWLRAITPEQEGQLAREIARLNGADVPATTNAQVRQVAETIVALQAKHREDANAAGAWVQRLDGRVTGRALGGWLVCPGSHDASPARDGVRRSATAPHGVNPKDMHAW
jgi:hypothetical protein